MQKHRGSFVGISTLIAIGVVCVSAWAIWKSRQTIVVTSDLGEKLISERSAVGIRSYDTNLNDEIKEDQELLIEQEADLSQEKQDLLSCKSQKQAEDDYSASIDKFLCAMDALGVSRSEILVRDTKARLAAMVKINGSMPQVKIIRYRLIAMNVNGDKSAGAYQEVYCFNKSLSNPDLQTWIDATSQAPPKASGQLLDVMQVKLCERYAIF